jgi:hypothetical protein
MGERDGNKGQNAGKWGPRFTGLTKQCNGGTFHSTNDLSVQNDQTLAWGVHLNATASPSVLLPMPSRTLQLHS